jgi:2-C-methyl-D-erythritol 4-phosphate cytidylyltransferase
MLQWSVEALLAVDEVSLIVIALPAGELSAAPPGTVAVAGGVQRSHSVRAALAACPDGPDAEPVIVHDAARPLASTALFTRALAELGDDPDADCVIAATPVTDTIKQVDADGRTVSATLERARLWAVQTPQVFRRAALARALAGASDELLDRATDDAWLVEHGGGTVRIVRAGPENLKVTTPLDLRVAELLLSERAR